MSEMKFDSLTPIEVAVEIEGKAYTLREASGDAACKYRNAQLERVEMGPEGKPSRFHGLADLEPLLVSLCLFNDENGKQVNINTIRSWPSRILKPLFDKAKEISELGEEEETIEDLQKKLAEAMEVQQKGEAVKNE
jgi:hypothetical protein